MPNTAIAPNPPQFPDTPQDYIKYLLKIRGISVQKMCDELYPTLSKSTIDKWLSFQTTETSFSNVKAMVKYLGGSLDYLAQIEAKADASSAPASPPPQEEKKIKADYPALALLVESYEKEIQRDAEHHKQEIDRIEKNHLDALERFRRLNTESRTIMIEQYKTATDNLIKANDKALLEQEKHLNAAIKGRNWWRILSLALIVSLLVVVGYAVFEFSSMESGITGYILRKNGIISMVGGGV